jgi:hypothetical protein
LGLGLLFRVLDTLLQKNSVSLRIRISGLPLCFFAGLSHSGKSGWVVFLLLGRLFLLLHLFLLLAFDVGVVFSCVVFGVDCVVLGLLSLVWAVGDAFLFRGFFCRVGVVRSRSVGSCLFFFLRFRLLLALDVGVFSLCVIVGVFCALSFSGLSSSRVWSSVSSVISRSVFSLPATVALLSKKSVMGLTPSFALFSWHHSANSIAGT